MAYPPYQQPLLDRHTGLVSKPWQLFFLALVNGTTEGTQLVDGSVPVAKLAPIASQRLLGRGTSGVGPVEELLIGTGLALTDLTLSVTSDGVEQAGYWTPISNGNPLAFELLYTSDTGTCVVGFVPTPS